ELSELLAVSEMTTRRYAGEMEDQLSIMGSHVIYRASEEEGATQNYLINKEAVRNPNKKNRLGAGAASLIEEGDVVFIDAGTTTPFLAEQIPDDLKFTAVCCSLNIFLILNQKKNCRLILTGGRFHEGTQIFSGRPALDIIRNIRITKAFISTAGISEKLGLTCFYSYETDLKKEVIKYSQHVYVVADSTKFDRVTIAYFADVTQAHTVIIDEGIAPDQEAWLQEAGLDVIKA
ncbi:MAG: DeoR/GlpR family DNA-binding transcription regulator, partial [Desulfovibrionales bacterium]|nr:DeoR/GlpR family DNA-binding transcription regulator [Desulfovibrionales bacterium]